MREFFKKYWGILLVLILSWWAVQPLFHSGFFSMHDNTQVVRVHQMTQALRDGQFPVRWVSDLGYGFGYPLFNFYAPLPYYVGAIFNLVGFDALWATKLMFILGILLAGVFMYLLAREFFGELGGILAGLFYMYAPYHAVDIYVRGAVGEFWAMAFLPLMTLGFYKVFTLLNTTGVSDGKNLKLKMKIEKLQFKMKKEQWKWIVIGAIGYAGVILSHNLTAMMALPFLAIGLLVCLIARLLGKEKSWKIKLHPTPYTLYPILLAIGLSAFYWLPAIFEMKFTDVVSQIGGGADFRDHFVCLSQLWSSPWGFAGSAPGCSTDGMSFQIGKLQLMLIPVVIFLLFSAILKKRHLNDIYHLSNRNAVVLLTFFAFLFAVFLSTEYSKPVWEMVKPMVYIQYPWRFLIFATFFISLSAAAIVIFFQNRILRLIIVGLLLAMLLPYRIKYFQPQHYLNLQSDDYINEENIKWKTSKISDEFLPKDFPKPKNPNEIVKEKIVSLDKFSQINNLEIKSDRYRFDFSGQNDTLILVRVAYFPGWKVFIDGKENPFSIENGQVFFKISKGQHPVEIILKNTTVRILGNIFSVLSLIILIGGFSYGRRKASS